jgi:hypothetical protein
MNLILRTAALAVAFVLVAASPARAEEAKMTGVVTKIEVAKDKKSAVATLKDRRRDAAEVRAEHHRRR